MNVYELLKQKLHVINIYYFGQILDLKSSMYNNAASLTVFLSRISLINCMYFPRNKIIWKYIINILSWQKKK